MNNIKVYPNPMNDQLYISIQGATLSKLELLSILGTKVAIIEIPKQKDEAIMIDASNLNSGIYFLNTYKDGNRCFRQKLLKF